MSHRYLYKISIYPTDIYMSHRYLYISHRYLYNRYLYNFHGTSVRKRHGQCPLRLDSHSTTHISETHRCTFHSCEDAEDVYRVATTRRNSLICRSFFAKELIIIGLFCGKRPLNIRHPMGLCHPVSKEPRLPRISAFLLYKSSKAYYGVATNSRLLKIIGLFCKRALKRDYILQKKPMFLTSALIVRRRVRCEELIIGLLIIELFGSNDANYRALLIQRLLRISALLLYKRFKAHYHSKSATGWRRCVGCLKLHVSFRKRATNNRALWRKMTCKDKASVSNPTDASFGCVCVCVCARACVCVCVCVHICIHVYT